MATNFIVLLSKHETIWGSNRVTYQGSYLHVGVCTVIMQGILS